VAGAGSGFKRERHRDVISQVMGHPNLKMKGNTK